MEFSKVSKRFAERHVLQHIDLRLEAGGSLVLLGANGAGKSTLLSIARGRIRPDGGQVRIAGEDPSVHGSVRAGMGFVPQQQALYPHLSVLENLQIFGRIMRVPRKLLRVRIQDALAWSELSDRRHEVVDRLSGGMLRWVNILAGILHHPAFLLLDEPSSGVDLAGCERIVGHLRRLRQGGMAILLATHDFDFAERLGGEVALLSAGTIRAKGQLEDLVREAFGAGRELIVTLKEAANAATVALLEAMDLRSVATADTWSGPWRHTMDKALDLIASLENRGAHVAEFRVVMPGLASLYRHHSGSRRNP